MNDKNHIRLLRHATLLIKLGGYKFLVDPMLSPKDAMDPVQNAGNSTRIPMVELPVSETELRTLLNETDAIIVTHTHRDHWDAAAQNLIDKNKTIFCQPVDAEKIKSQGFLNVISINEKLKWNEITIHRTGGQHGTGEIGKKMGGVSGFVLDNGLMSIYIAGDTIWCAEVKNALQKYKPNVTVLNSGGARFTTGDPITMTPEDVIAVGNELSSTQIIAVHMDTVNHCFATRAILKKSLTEIAMIGKIKIPADGELIYL